MSNVKVRSASRSDVALVQGIARRTIDHSYRSFLGDDLVDAFIDSGECDSEISQHLPDLHLLVDNDQVLGFSIVLDDLVHLMMIDHAHHREGHGGRLLRHAEAMIFAAFSKGRSASRLVPGLRIRSSRL